MSKPHSFPEYSLSSVWSDISPIPLHDSPNDSVHSLATIAYTQRYAEAMSYLRAIMARNEFSERALSLTSDIISMNPAHYTVWLYRGKVLKELGDSEGEGEDGYLRRVRKELAWLDGVSRRNLKNYQIWHHRATLTSALPVCPATEIPFITSVLALDAKNYHVWSYRQWLCRHFPALLSSAEEMKATEALIDEDIRNNSAWNHRWFLVFGAAELESREKGEKAVAVVVDEDVVDREIIYAQEKIRLAPQNQSPWNYLRGLQKKGGRDVGEMKRFCEEFVVGEGDVWGEDVRSSRAVEWLSEAYAEEGLVEKATTCLDSLSEKWDPVRRNYWEYRKGMLGG